MSQELVKQMLSANFSLYELVRSEVAERQAFLLEMQLAPPKNVRDNLKYLVDTTLQPIRERFQYPMRITSGYRSDALNRAMGGSLSSQHAIGEAADVVISDGFLHDERTETLRASMNEQIENITGKSVRNDVNANFYLFAFLCLNLGELDVDEVGHEYGAGFGYPAWVHISTSRTHNKRQICAAGRYVSREQCHPDLITALSFGT